MFLTNKDMLDLVELRHDLHRHPEISGEEKETAGRIRAFLEQAKPDRLLADLGGHGVAAVYDSGKNGPAILIRSELDALPIHEKSEAEYRSGTDGKGHLCGHDGHSTILTALALGLSRNRPQTGSVILLYQPAEETGAGAAAVIADPRFGEIKPDYSFSLHNLPGLPFGHVSVVKGPVNCASRGIKIRFSGKTAHASSPEHGVSPMRAISQLMPALTDLGFGFPPQPDFSMVTITHAAMGEAAFGISPADAEIWATLRTLTDDRMEKLCADAELLAKKIADDQKLTLDISYDDIFLHCENAPEAVAYILQALLEEKVSSSSDGLPMRASEDFGRFRAVSSSAMFFLGAGRDYPNLHNPDYDFPDGLIDIGARIFMRIIRNLTDAE
ncbi:MULTISPECIES: amidohydrolase [Rhizobium/Agrobacterium group]|uniref:Cellulose synthesis protein n=1 Tax=Agrobacterium tomkonis CFBP 6623 TaxID=1183432 RepID=A0A1S7S7Z7_9HYPH|nr:MULTISPECIES: amidohydrolase [Rhizobium/Agrobacterium group]KRA55295.1 peptidase M20 [Rhizobium sp. Root651]QCL90876.1 amidohydrolase [Agrobacterium tumefaciens]TKT57791.1 amidohydrolase [Agrobacterium sp. LC34]CUX63545.1 cellulose synthesis protein [Agrobacterium tomkonis CFBP 6623]